MTDITKNTINEIRAELCMPLLPGLAQVEHIASADVPGKCDNEVAYLVAEKGIYIWDDTEKQWSKTLRD